MSLDACPDPRLAQTHQALFETWFPLSELPIPDAIRPDIGRIAAEVREGMLEGASTGLLYILGMMTVPEKLPFYPELRNSANPAAQAFVATPNGFGDLAPALREPLFSYLFDGDCGAPATRLAMEIREIYLSVIWDLPLAVPITEIQPPQVFMQNPEIYAKRHAPRLPPSKLYYDAATGSIRHRDGDIDYLVIGSGPGGAMVCHDLQKAGKRVVLVERGPFVVWGSMNTRSYPALMFRNDQATSLDNGIVYRSGQTLGGGSTVNIDLAFSPLEATIQARVSRWIEDGLLDADRYSPGAIATAYQYVCRQLETCEVEQDELNRDNQALWNGAKKFGVDPDLYHLNRFPVDLSPSPVNDKRDAAHQLLLRAAEDPGNPLSIIPDALVNEVLFSPTEGCPELRASGVSLTLQTPWTTHGNTVVDPCGLGIAPGTTVSIAARNVVLAAGTLGTTRILLHTAGKTPAVANPRIGEGLILHPSFPLIGLFDQTVNLLEGLDSATYLDAFGVTPGFIFETMGGLPAYGALMVPGNGRQVYAEVSRFNQCVGFGCMLVDTPSDSNRVVLDETGEAAVQYRLSDGDKQRYRQGIAIGIRMMFLAGAKQVILPSNENFLGSETFDPMVGVYLTDIAQADLVEKNLQFIPNRTMVTSAHLQAANKIGQCPKSGVVSPNQRVWNVETGGEIPNLYVMDSSMFPTSVGANPMQALYTFAHIFAANLLQH